MNPLLKTGMKVYVNLASGKAYTQKQLLLGLAPQLLLDEEECQCCRNLLGKAPYEQVTMEDMLNYLENVEWQVTFLSM